MTEANSIIPVFSHGRPSVRGTRGMVSSAHPLASQAGIRMLQQGGNAFDAIAATAAALNVVEPFMSGLAGLGMATVYTASDRRVRSLDFHPPVPGGFDASRITKAETIDGANASGVPGNLSGWCFLVQEHGNLTLQQIFEPAIEYATEGVVTSPFFTAMIKASLGRNMQPEWRDLYFDGSNGGATDAVLRQPDLARTLAAIAAEGPAYLYDGTLGAKMVSHLGRLGGCLSFEDLAAVQPLWEEPLSVSFAGLDVHVPPPPAESFQFLLTLGILEATGLDRAEHLSVEHLDRVFRAIRLAAECRIQNNRCTPDRARALLGQIEISRLCSRLETAEAAYGRTEGFGDGPLSMESAAREHTTSLSAVDRDGNAVCLTQSLGSMFGSGVVIPGTGVCMNNFMNWGDLNPASANYLKGGQRFGMCLAPSISLSGGDFVLALGTPGSFGILQTQVQAMVHHRLFGLDLQAAIDAPRGRLWDGRRIDLENRIEAHVIAQLKQCGHEISSISPFSMVCGGMHAILRNPQTGVLTGAADSRRDGLALSY